MGGGVRSERSKGSGEDARRRWLRLRCELRPDGVMLWLSDKFLGRFSLLLFDWLSWTARAVARSLRFVIFPDLRFGFVTFNGKKREETMWALKCLYIFVWKMWIFNPS
jgi:hypothetical protein